MFRRFFIMAWIFLAVFSSLAMAQVPEAITSLLGPDDSLFVIDAKNEILFKIHADKPLIPASTLKVFTGLAALDTLGSSWRFSTQFYLDQNQNLKVYGLGDPLLISEVLNQIAGMLALKINTCNQIILDSSYFINPLIIPGTGTTDNPYDSPVGALCANFNTVNFLWGLDFKPMSAEPQTPMILFAEKIVHEKKMAQGRVLLTQKHGQTTLYAGHLLKYFLKQHNVACGDVVLGKINPDDTLICSFKSPFTMLEVVQKSLKFSNNFMANQVFLTLGAKEFGPPATLEKAVCVATQFAEKQLGIKKLQIVEGSGISRKNKISASQMMRVLEKFQPYHDLMPKKNGVWQKTGTLKGVRTLVGYFSDNKNSQLARFVIFINSPRKSAQKVLDQIMLLK